MSLRAVGLKNLTSFSSWALFLFPAVFFVISAFRSGDIPGLIGAFLFLLACIVFLLPHVTRAIAAGGRGAKPK